MAKGSHAETTLFWAIETPAGQRVIVEREHGWVVTCDGGNAVRHHLLDVALIEAIRSDVELHWSGINPARWASLIADDIASPWRNERNEQEPFPRALDRRAES